MDCPECGNRMNPEEDVEEDVGGNTISYKYWVCPCCDEYVDYKTVVSEENK